MSARGVSGSSKYKLLVAASAILIAGVGVVGPHRLLHGIKHRLKPTSAAASSARPVAVHPVGPETAGGWEKEASNPVLGGDLGTCFDISVLKEGTKYRMWFSWRPKKSIAYTESSDGVHWAAPDIALAPVEGSSWELDLNRPIVIRKSGKYQMWYTGQFNGHSAIGMATSTDGKTWQRAQAEPVMKAEAAWEKGAVMCPHVIWDGKANTYKMWYSGGDQYEPDALGYALSTDGIHWSKEASNPVFTPDKASNWDNHRVTAAFVWQEGAYYQMAYIGFHDDHYAQIGLARSKDGIHNWERHAQNPIIRPGNDKNGWDFDAVYKPSLAFDGKKWLLWYNGRTGSKEQIGVAYHPGRNLWP